MIGIVTRHARLLIVGWWLNLKLFAASAFDGVLGIVYPLFFATAAFLIYRIQGDPDVMVYAGLGAAVMGVWSAVATSGAAALQRARWHGTLELLVAAPVPFALATIPITVALATIGLYSLLATLMWGWLLFGIPFSIASPLAFGLSVLVTVVAVGMFGFLLTIVAVRYRTAWALGNAFEYPGWLLCGFVVPLAILPPWVKPISYLLAPTWGMTAIREAAAGGVPVRELALCAALAIGYGVGGALLAETVLRSARRTATLSLT